MAGANTLTFTDADWDKEVLNSEVPVLVDFWAEWCGPCRMMTPTIDAIADDYAGRVKVGKLNIDENGGTGMRYRVQSIPTLLLFKGGQIVGNKIGVAGKPDLQKMLDAQLPTPGMNTGQAAELNGAVGKTVEPKAPQSQPAAPDKVKAGS
jgi:thioredoxin 1